MGRTRRQVRGGVRTISFWQISGFVAKNKTSGNSVPVLAHGTRWAQERGQQGPTNSEVVSYFFTQKRTGKHTSH